MTSLEEQVQVYQALVRQIAGLEEKKRELGQAISQQMPQKAMAVAGWMVRRYERLLFRTPLEEARKLGATKTKEILNQKLLKKLYQSGEPVSGVSSFAYIQVSEQKEEHVQ